MVGKKRVALIVSSHGHLGTTGRATGWYLPEVAHPHHAFAQAGLKIDFISSAGGAAPVDGNSVLEYAPKDPISKDFWLNADVQSRLRHTKAAADVNSEDYSVVFFAGGHGPMFDTPFNGDLQRLCREVYENGGVVSALCHGPAGLVNVKLSNGEFLLNGKQVTGFSNAEETAIGLTKEIPFSLEDKLRERGGVYSCAALWQNHVQSSQRVVTGQNPASATATAEAVLKALGSA